MEERKMKHFCTCDDLECGLNPNNPKNQALSLGCDPCIRKNLKAGEIPSCFFNLAGGGAGARYLSDWADFSIGGFVEFYQKHHREETARDESKQRGFEEGEFEEGEFEEGEVK